MPFMLLGVVYSY